MDLWKIELTFWEKICKYGPIATICAGLGTITFCDLSSSVKVACNASFIVLLCLLLEIRKLGNQLSDLQERTASNQRKLVRCMSDLETSTNDTLKDQKNFFDSIVSPPKKNRN